MPVFASRPPRSAALAPFVSRLHLAGGGPAAGLQRVLPNGLPSLMINLTENAFRTWSASGETLCRTSGAVFQGPHARSVVIDTGGDRRLLSVEFRLGGAAAFFPRGALAGTQELLIELDLLWGRDGAVLRERLLEAGSAEEAFAAAESVLERRLGAERPDPVASFAAAAFERGASVSDAAAAGGWLARTFHRRFEAATGLRPKLYARVRRLQRVVGAAARLPRPDWVGLAAEHGYADQAHLIHEFRDLGGIRPSEHRPLAGEPNHVPLGSGG